LVRFDEENRLRNGLKKYRVEIFNRVGELVLEAQRGGYVSGGF
jgi:hypothetical protein